MNLHASCVAVAGGGGVILLGPSGAGKSQLALRMLALGALLVADDRTVLSRDGPALRAEAPTAIRGLIEARGIGLLRTPALASARVVLAVDLARREGARMPPPRVWTALGVEVTLLHTPETGCLPSALMLYLNHGVFNPP